MGFLPIILMFVVLYFLMIRPQMKRQKEHKNMVENLTVGSEVVTAGGMVGRITRITDSGYLALEVADLASKPVEIMVQRQAVTAVLPKDTIRSL
jgi:preprotein translocase subunit YajC